MSPLPSPSRTCAGEHCITCADDGVPMAVVRLDEQRGLALCVDAGGARHTVEIALVEPLAADRVVLVHAGVAIAALPPGEDCPPAGPTSLQPSALPSESHHRPAGATSLQRSANEVAICAAPAAAGGAS